MRGRGEQGQQQHESPYSTVYVSRFISVSGVVCLLCWHSPVFYSSCSYQTHAGLHLVVNSHELLLSVLQSQPSFPQACVCLGVLLCIEIFVGHTQCAVALLNNTTYNTILEIQNKENIIIIFN